MRIFYQISVIIFVILSLFIIKSDLLSVYKRSATYVQTNVISKPSSVSTQALPKVDVSVTKANNKALDQVVQVGGSLKVADSLLVNNSNHTNLTVKGVIEYTNQNRQENGNLVALKENSKLNFSAEKKLQDMFVKQYFEHESPSGVSVGDLAGEVSYDYIIIGENLALGNFKNDQTLLDAWMASPGHRANILNKHYTEIGVAVGKSTYKGQEIWMAVQHFGLPQSACPTIDKVLNGIIIIDQEKLKIMDADLIERRQRIDSGAVYDGMTTNEQIDKFNSLVVIYNQLIVDVREKIIKYNDEVRAYNSCISFNTD